MSLRSWIGGLWLGWIVRLEGDSVLFSFVLSAPVLGVDMVDSLQLSPVLSNSFSTWTTPREAKSAHRSRFVKIAKMDQGSALDVDNAHQMLKSTKAKMREILAHIAANQEDHGQPQGAQVSII